MSSHFTDGEITAPSDLVKKLPYFQYKCSSIGWRVLKLIQMRKEKRKRRRDEMHCLGTILFLSLDCLISAH